MGWFVQLVIKECVVVLAVAYAARDEARADILAAANVANVQGCAEQEGGASKAGVEDRGCEAKCYTCGCFEAQSTECCGL